MNADTLTFAKAIADPTRQAIMNLLCCNWLSVGNLAEQIGVRQAGLLFAQSRACDVLLWHIDAKFCAGADFGRNNSHQEKWCNFVTCPPKIETPHPQQRSNYLCAGHYGESLW